MHDIYYYDADTGELVGVDPKISADLYRVIADQWHHEKGFFVKVYNEQGCVVYTAG